MEVGGGLREYTLDGRKLLDGYGVDEMSSSGRGQVLIPWPNRIQDGRYSFDGEDHQLPLDDVAEQDAIHGLVRWASWTAAGRAEDRVVMEHMLHPQPGYPFSLALSVEYLLSEEGLLVRTTATNRGPRPCPYGSGNHPYLASAEPSVDSLTLRIPARTLLRSDERGIPIGSLPVEGTDYDFRRPRRIGATVLDHAFTDLERGEDGRARVELGHPDRDEAVTLWVDETYPYLMVFTGDPLPDVSRRSLAVEPMTCPPNAFRSGRGPDPARARSLLHEQLGHRSAGASVAMIGIDSESFLAVVVAAALAAFVSGLVSSRLPLPVVVLEVIFGILIGPDVLGFAEPDAFLAFFSNLGLGMLFFFAGYEIDFERIRGHPLLLGVLGWLLSLALAYSLGGLLTLTGLVLSLLFTGSALATTAIGTLIPVLSDAGELRTRFGTYLLAAGAVGEFGPVLLITLVFSTKSPSDERADPDRLRRRRGCYGRDGRPRRRARLGVARPQSRDERPARDPHRGGHGVRARGAGLHTRPGRTARRLRGGRDRAPRAART